MLLEDFSNDDPRCRAFNELADAQRGAPELAMLRAQRALSGGVLCWCVEHVGDLTHRMAQYPDSEGYYSGYELVKPKVDRALGMLRSKYISRKTGGFGFQEEHAENMRNNANCREIELADYEALCRKALLAYAEEHRKLKVYNLPQLWARDAAIALGEQKFDRAEILLSKLEDLLVSKEKWNEAASQFNLLNEAHHHYPEPTWDTEFQPLSPDDTITLYHGFRDRSDAVRAAQHGLSGAERADRAYSYEFDNNPKGLFVSISKTVAMEFGMTVMEFTCRVNDLEQPVWPGGQYTVQGQLSQSWGRGHEGRRNRRAAQIAASKEDIGYAPEYVRNSHNQSMAMRLFTSGERQALFIGHLNPEQISAFFVSEGARNNYVQMSREDFLRAYADLQKESRRIFGVDEPFSGEKFMQGVKEMAGRDDVHSDVLWIKEQIAKAPQGRRVATFENLIGQWLWPKQKPAAVLWLRSYK